MTDILTEICARTRADLGAGVRLSDLLSVGVMGRAFPLARDTDKKRVSPGDMMPRVYGFLTIWILACLLFPIVWVGAAFATWIAVLTPGLIEIHRQFQNIPDPG